MEPPKAAGNGGASCSMTSVFGGHQTSLKGEDGLRVERLTIGSDKIVAAAVCDGHGGHEASALVIEEMLPRLQAEAAGDASMAALGAAAERVFLSLHATLNEPERGITAGTTATLILVNESRSEITSAAVGDSFAALYEAPSAEAKSVMTTSLTANHRLECNETERARVRAAGGKLGRARTRDGIEAGPIRAWPGGIACARAIGDSDCGGLVLARPDVTSMAFPEQGGVVVIASDGLWDALSFAAACKTALAARDPQAAAEALVKKALKLRGLRDDTTCVVLVGGAALPAAASPGGGHDMSTSPDASDNDSVSSSPSVMRSPATRRRSSISSLMRLPTSRRGPSPQNDGASTSRDASVKAGRLFGALDHGGTEERRESLKIGIRPPRAPAPADGTATPASGAPSPASSRSTSVGGGAVLDGSADAAALPMRVAVQLDMSDDGPPTDGSLTDGGAPSVDTVPEVSGSSAVDNLSGSSTELSGSPEQWPTQLFSEFRRRSRGWSIGS